MILVLLVIFGVVRSQRPVCFDISDAVETRPSPACRTCFEYNVDFTVNYDQFKRLSGFRMGLCVV